MRETYTEPKTVEEQRERIICDYCKLVSSDDTQNGKESFRSVIVEPKSPTEVIEGQADGDDFYRSSPIMEIMDAQTPDEAVEALFAVAKLAPMSSIEICPSCQDGLFGEESPEGIRRGGILTDSQ